MMDIIFDVVAAVAIARMILHFINTRAVRLAAFVIISTALLALPWFDPTLALNSVLVVGSVNLAVWLLKRLENRRMTCS